MGPHPNTRDHASDENLERGTAGIGRLGAEFLFDAQELIVFGGAIRTRERAGLDLPAIGRDREIGRASCRERV